MLEIPAIYNHASPLYLLQSYRSHDGLFRPQSGGGWGTNGRHSHTKTNRYLQCILQEGRLVYF